MVTWNNNNKSDVHIESEASSLTKQPIRWVEVKDPELKRRIPENAMVQLIEGTNFDIPTHKFKDPIPSTRNFHIYKYMNP